MFDRVLNMPLDYLSCFAVVLRRIYHSWTPPPPPPPPFNKSDLPKIESLGGRGTKFFARNGDKPEKGGGVDVAMGNCHFFITFHFNHIYCVCGESKVPFITFQIFSILS